MHCLWFWIYSCHDIYVFGILWSEIGFKKIYFAKNWVLNFIQKLEGFLISNQEHKKFVKKIKVEVHSLLDLLKSRRKTSGKS